MFKCGLCRKSSSPRETAVRVITEEREKTYPKRLEAHRAVGRDFRTGKRVRKDDPGGTGHEIVHEVLAHKECASTFLANRAAETLND